MEEERKPVFTNLYLPSEETYRQMYRRMRKTLTVIIIILSCCAVAYMTYTVLRMSWLYDQFRGVYLKTPQAWLLIGMAAYLVFFLVFTLFAPRRLAKRSMKRMLEMNSNKIPEIRARFLEDAVEFHNAATNGESTLSFASFAKIHETKDLFLIWTKQKMVIPLAKDGFTGIDVVGFRAFMDEHCPQAKRRWTPEG